MNGSKKYENASVIAVGRRNGDIELYEISDENQLIHKWELKSSEKDECSYIISLEVVGDRWLFACTKSGRIIAMDLGNFEVSNGQLPIPSAKGKQSLCIFRRNPFKEEEFAVGGNEIDVKIVNIKAASDCRVEVKTIWKSKNVKNDKLDLRVPIWVHNILFQSETEFITVTKYGQLRMYDTSKGRRPFADIKISDHPITSLSFADSNMKEIIYSDTHMTTALFNLDEKLSLGKFAGATGAVQDIHVCGTLLATGGLDRYLRVFDISTREIAGKIFIGTQVSRVWILEGEDGKEDRDELWDNLDQTDDSDRKVKRQRMK